VRGNAEFVFFCSRPGSSSSGSSVSGIGPSPDASGFRSAPAATSGRNGELVVARDAVDPDVAPGAGVANSDDRADCAALAPFVAPRRGVGAVTPGMTNIERACDGAAAVGTVLTTVVRGVDVAGAELICGGEDSDAGPSSGGGSSANARLVPRNTTQNDRTTAARNMGQVSRQRGLSHGFRKPPTSVIGSHPARKSFFLEDGRTSHRLTTTMVTLARDACCWL
jgi:hypothetical protein